MKFDEALDIWIGDYVQIKDTFKLVKKKLKTNIA